MLGTQDPYPAPYTDRQEQAVAGQSVSTAYSAAKSHNADRS